MGDRKRKTRHAARIIADKITSLATAVHEPATMLLLGSVLIGFPGCGRKKFLKK
jgi:hypothetical protein